MNQYNQVSHMYVNCNTDIAGKCAVQYAYGYLGADDTLISPWDGRVMGQNLNGAGNALFSVSAPIICNILTSSEKLIPSFLLPSIRMAFTIDQLANFTNYTAAGTSLTGFSISNIQITYFGDQIQSMNQCLNFL